MTWKRGGKRETVLDTPMAINSDGLGRPRNDRRVHTCMRVILHYDSMMLGSLVPLVRVCSNL